MPKVYSLSINYATYLLNGYDKQMDNWYLFTEKGGWARVIEPGTPEKRTKIKYEDFGSGLVNASASLQYEKNPTIPPGAIEPHYWIRPGGSRDIGGYTINLSRISVYKEEKPFTRSTKPFGTPTMWLEYMKFGKGFVTVVQPNRNPSPENKKGKINLPLTFDQDRFDQKEKGVVDDLVDYLLNDKINFYPMFAAASPWPAVFERYIDYLGGPDGEFSTPRLQEPGEELSLFDPDVQASVEDHLKKLEAAPLGSFGQKAIPYDEVDIPVEKLPVELALRPLTANYRSFRWGDIQP